MRFKKQILIAIYNIIFHILNLLIKFGIQTTFRFYINYYEVNINHIYHMIFLIVKKKIENFI